MGLLGLLVFNMVLFLLGLVLIAAKAINALISLIKKTLRREVREDTATIELIKRKPEEKTSRLFNREKKPETTGNNDINCIHEQYYSPFGTQNNSKHLLNINRNENFNLIHNDVNNNELKTEINCYNDTPAISDFVENIFKIDYDECSGNDFYCNMYDSSSDNINKSKLNDQISLVYESSESSDNENIYYNSNEETILTMPHTTRFIDYSTSLKSTPVSSKSCQVPNAVNIYQSPKSEINYNFNSVSKTDEHFKNRSQFLSHLPHSLSAYSNQSLLNCVQSELCNSSLICFDKSFVSLAKAGGDDYYTLPKNVIPFHYDVDLTPGIEKRDKNNNLTHYFEGNVSIHVKVAIATNVIEVNSKGLKMEKILIIPLSEYEQLPKVIDWKSNEKNDRIIMRLSYKLEAQSKWIIRFKYTGIHNDNMVGFYRSKVKSNNEKEISSKYIFSTQFESVECSAAIPCWDEPVVKATFKVKLIVPKEVVALSNTEVLNDSVIENTPYGIRKIVEYAQTPIMSTYLLAFVIGELEYLEKYTVPSSNSPNSTPVRCRVYSQPGYARNCVFALESVCKYLSYYQDFFGYDYPLKKLDNVAIPDFRSGAMENWGLVTYREVALIFDGDSDAKELTSLKQKLNIAEVVSHELAHQWFGNLVTMRWWNDIWLNEGFATFCAVLSTNTIYPDTQPFIRFMIDNTSHVLSVDSLSSSHEIDLAVKSSDYIEQYFDAINYSKGASIINMVYSYLGHENFKKGIQLYIKKHLYQNTVSNDIWKALDEANNTNLVNNMENWIKKPGYPLISVDLETYNPELKQITLSLSQKRYFSSTINNNDSSIKNLNTIWWIPLIILVSNGEKQTYFKYEFNSKKLNLTFPYEEGPNSFWKLNVDANGFYRVMMGAKNTGKITRILSENTTVLSIKDKLNLINDIGALCRSGELKFDKILSLLETFKLSREANYFVLSLIWSTLYAIKSYLYLKPKYITIGLQKFISSIFMPILNMIGYDPTPGEALTNSLLRTVVLTALASVKQPEVIKVLMDKFERYVNGDETALNMNIRDITYNTVMKYTNQPKNDFERMVNLYKNAQSPNHAITILRALGAINSTSILEILVNEYLFKEDFVRTQDMYILVGSIANNNPDKKYANTILWDYITNNWESINKKFAATPSLLGKVLSAPIYAQVGYDVTQKVNDWIDGKDLENFPKYKELYKKRQSQLSLIKKDIVEALETLDVTNKWVTNYSKDIEEWLVLHKYM